MDRDSVIATIRMHEAELRAAGVDGVAVFGSVARGEEGKQSDIDLVIRLTDAAKSGGFAYYGRLDALRRWLADLLGAPVDVVAEPVDKPGLRAAIERDQAVAF